MSEKLEHLQELIGRLGTVGVHVVCVGGAARDLYLGREPKDYDLAVYRIDPHYGFGGMSGHAREAVFHIAGNVVTLDPATAEGYCDEAGDRGLVGVYECEYKGMTIQVLEFTDDRMELWKGDPYFIVEEHDCTLNFAWLEPSPVSGELVPRVHGEFPSPFNGSINEFRNERNLERRMYIQGKFPEFTHK